MKDFGNGCLSGPLTLGDLCREPRLEGYSRRQIDYAIREHGIAPTGRAGIIRLFDHSQVPVILAAVRTTARVNH